MILSLSPVQNALQRRRPLASYRRDMAAVGDPLALGVFPMAAIEKSCGLQGGSIYAVEASRIHCYLVGLRARYIERMHAAIRAEWVLRHPGFKCVYRQYILALKQRKIRWKDWQMKNALLRANAATTL